MNKIEAELLRLEKIEDAARDLCVDWALHGQGNLANPLQALRDAVGIPKEEKLRRPRRGSVIAQLGGE